MLSKRMEAVVSMVSPQSFTVADIGCDHAYVSIALIERKIAENVVAMDVRQGPLGIAADNVAAAGLQGKIDLRLSNGLEKLLPGEVDAVVIAGMGGMLVKSILESGEKILHYEKMRPSLILQPQSDLKEVRIFLHSSAYHIVQEKMLIDEGKYYTVIKAEPGTCNQIVDSFVEADGMQYWNVKKDAQGIEQYTEADWQYGRYNLEHRDAILFAYLKKEQKNLFKIYESISCNLSGEEGQISARTKERASAIYRAIKINRWALQKYYNYEKLP